MIKILFICHGRRLKGREKPVKSMVSWRKRAFTIPLLHHLGKRLDVTVNSDRICLPNNQPLHII